jgi:ubiquitin carboxyl-terminal hydrolase 4/11/15
MAVPATVPPPEQQHEIIKELEKSPLFEAGDTAYLVDARWYRNWENRARSGYGTSHSSAIGPINNTVFLDASGKIKKDAVENNDYRYVNEAMWNQLLEWYGGGPPVTAECVFDEHSKVVRVAVRRIPFIARYQDSDIVMTVHKYVKISVLKAQIMEKFNIPKDTPTRLIDFWQNRATGCLQDDELVSRYNIIDDQVIVLDTKNDAGEWKLNYMRSLVVSSTTSSSTIPSNASMSHPSPTFPSPTINSYVPSAGFYSSTGSPTRYSAGFSSGYSTGSSIGYSRSHGPWIGPGICGLVNLGNTCFFNSAVQCLLHTVPLVRHFLTPSWTSEINSHNRLGTQGVLVTSFTNLVTEFYRGTTSVVDPGDLKYQIGRFAEQFAGYEQNDSHELLVYLLDALHEDLNRCRRHPGDASPVVEDVIGDSTNDSSVALRAWSQHRLKNDSFIVDLAHGQLRSRLICPSCNRVSVVFDPYCALTVPLERARSPVRVVFIPLDHRPSVASLQLCPHATDDDVSREVSTFCGRSIRAAIGLISSSFPFTWHVPDLGIATYPGEVYYVFELSGGGGLLCLSHPIDANCR